MTRLITIVQTKDPLIAGPSHGVSTGAPVPINLSQPYHPTRKSGDDVRSAGERHKNDKKITYRCTPARRNTGGAAEWNTH